MPAYATRTSASPGPGAATGASTSAIEPGSSMRTAVTCVPRKCQSSANRSKCAPVLRVLGDEVDVELDAEARARSGGRSSRRRTSGSPGAACLTSSSAKSLKCSWILKFGVQAARCRLAAVSTGPPTLCGATST